MTSVEIYHSYPTIRWQSEPNEKNIENVFIEIESKYEINKNDFEMIKMLDWT